MNFGFFDISNARWATRKRLDYISRPLKRIEGPLKRAKARFWSSLSSQNKRLSQNVPQLGPKQETFTFPNPTNKACLSLHFNFDKFIPNLCPTDMKTGNKHVQNKNQPTKLNNNLSHCSATTITIAQLTS